jgi:O-antigen/teichoic acid export membrane protein
MDSPTNRLRAVIQSIRRFLSQGAVGQAFRSKIVQNAVWMFWGQGLQLVGRLAYFVIIARVLGPTGYGTFIACVALVATVSPFASCGTGNVMIKYAALNREALPAYFGNALVSTIFSGTVLTFAVWILRPYVLPASATSAMLIAVAIADLFGTELIGICLYAFLSLEQGRRYSHMAALSTGIRLVAALGLLFSSHSALHWAYLYAASAILAAVTGVVGVSLLCARPRFDFGLFVPSMREGVHFATALASQSVYNDIDKTMLARLSSVESAAIYAVAYRLIEPAILPIRSMGTASFPEFFRTGTKGGVTSSYEFAKRILKRSMPYGVATAVGLFVVAGFIPYILGPAYKPSTEALRWLCVLPAFKCVHIFLSDTLTGANFQWQTSSAQIFVSIFNVLINLWIIRAFSWRGAAWSSLMTDGLLMVLLYLIIRWHVRREKSEVALSASQPAFSAGEQS